MSPKTFLIATAALASAAAAQPALAAGGPSQGEPPLRAAVMFNLLDRDGDGAIDKVEAVAVTTAIFAALDANGDDKLAKEELAAAVGRMHMGAGPGLYRGGHGDDGARGHMGRGGWFGGDAPRQGMMGPPGEEGDTARGGPGSMMGQMMGPMMGQGTDDGRPLRLRMHDFATIDTDGDGVISRDEFDAAAPMTPGMGPAR